MLVDVPYPPRSGYLGGRRRCVSAGALDAKEHEGLGLRPVPERSKDLSGAAAGAYAGHVSIA